MTVAEVGDSDILCFWFQEKERFRRKTFPAATLVAEGPETKVFDPPATVEVSPTIAGEGEMGKILAHSLETQKKVALQKLDETKPLLRDD
jgi:hypothetical protein